jgi:hypothetical protein
VVGSGSQINQQSNETTNNYIAEYRAVRPRHVGTNYCLVARLLTTYENRLSAFVDGKTSWGVRYRTNDCAIAQKCTGCSGWDRIYRNELAVPFENCCASSHEKD